MTDEQQPADGGNAGATEQQGPPNARIIAQFVRDLSFENVAAQEGTRAEGQPEISVNVNLDAANAGQGRYAVSMKINATAKIGEATRFLVELDYVGVFEISNVPQEHMHAFLFVECPRQILPFARRIVADVTRDGGYPPLMLDNVDFAAMYRQRVEQMRAQQEAQQAAGNGGPAGDGQDGPAA